MAPLRQRLKRLFALVGTTLLLSACSFIEIQDAPLTTFDPAGPNARQIDGLFWMVFWVATVIFVLVMGALVVMLVVFRDKGKDDDPEPVQLHGNAKLEVLWTVIPALILAAISVPTVSSIFELTGCDSDSMRVEVTGHQWWFEFHYPDQNIDTANVLVMPVGEEVCLEMTSDDVIHNFWVPALHGKRYIIPGQTTLLRLEADETGEFWGHCAEFCGLSHSLMRTRALVLEPGDFDRWVSRTSKHQPSSPCRGLRSGMAIRSTSTSNVSNATLSDLTTNPHPTLSAVRRLTAPTLPTLPPEMPLPERHFPRRARVAMAALREWLADPPSVKPGSFMPNLALTSQEIDSLIVWLESNK